MRRVEQGRKVEHGEKQEPLNIAAGRLYSIITQANKLFYSAS